MKNIFIGGVAKSGKSRLASMLCEEKGFNHLPLDYFASSFKHNFPDVGITSNVIIDSAHIMPNDIIKYLDTDKWDIYFLGYPNITKEDKISEIKKYVRGGWTSKRSEEELLKIFDELISISKEIKNECETNNIKFIDVSNGDILDLFED